MSFLFRMHRRYKLENNSKVTKAECGNRKLAYLNLSSWKGPSIQTTKLLLWIAENKQVEMPQWSRQGLGLFFALWLRTVRSESIFPFQKTQNDNREAQLSSQLINTSTWFWSSWSWKPYILFSSSMPPAKKLHFFPLFKQAARVMAWWTNFTSFYSVFSIFNTASSRPDGTNAIASKSIHLAAFLKWQIWWIEPRLLYKAPFQNALPGTCLL